MSTFSSRRQPQPQPQQHEQHQSIEMQRYATQIVQPRIVAVQEEVQSHNCRVTTDSRMNPSKEQQEQNFYRDNLLWYISGTCVSSRRNVAPGTMPTKHS